MRNILIIQGHPDADGLHFGHTLAEKYSSAARSADHSVREVVVAKLEFPLLSSKSEFENGSPCDDILQVQSDIAWADHIVVIYPLWLGTMPALLKGLFEQVFRPGFVHEGFRPVGVKSKRLHNKSARIIVTMGMPAFVYRWFYRSHSLKNLKRNILSFCGFKPVKHTVIGGVCEGNEGLLSIDLSRVARLGRLGQ